MSGSYIISVSYCTGCYRHIQISKNATFFELHTAIIDAFEFEDDHSHAFFLDNRRWSQNNSLFNPNIEDPDNTTTEYRLSQKGLIEGYKFIYIFDFGDGWTFNCKVLRCTDYVSKRAVVIKHKGESPSQYDDD